MVNVNFRLSYDKETHDAIIEKQWFYRIAKFNMPVEHMYDVGLDKGLLIQLRDQDVDLFTFIERSFLDNNKLKRQKQLFSDPEPIGLLKISSYDEWFRSITHNARWQTKKGIRVGLKTKVVDIDDTFTKSAFKIYNETPIRQGRKYSGYGLSLMDVKLKFSNMKGSEVIGAYFEDEQVGLIWISYGDRVAAVNSFLSLLSHREKYPNDVLLAATVRRCVEKGYHYLAYWNMGFNPGLDFFKKSHGFKVFNVPRFYIPLSYRGELAIKLKLHRPFEHSMPMWLVRPLLPLYNKGSKFIPVKHLK